MLWQDWICYQWLGQRRRKGHKYVHINMMCSVFEILNVFFVLQNKLSKDIHYGTYCTSHYFYWYLLCDICQEKVLFIETPTFHYWTPSNHHHTTKIPPPNSTSTHYICIYVCRERISLGSVAGAYRSDDIPLRRENWSSSSYCPHVYFQ